MIVVEVRKVKGGVRVGKKVKPNYKRPQYVGKLKATREQSPIKKPAPRKEPWA